MRRFSNLSRAIKCFTKHIIQNDSTNDSLFHKRVDLNWGQFLRMHGEYIIGGVVSLQSLEMNHLFLVHFQTFFRLFQVP